MKKPDTALAPHLTDAPPATCAQHRHFVGPVELYDVFSAVQFNLLTFLGLREHHTLLDIGCGSLRAGRLFLSYLLPGRYCGVEPEKWLVDAAIGTEVGADLMHIKKPLFSHDGDFRFERFGRMFDFVLAYSIFSHATAKQIRTCLREARHVMHEHSLFAATFVEGETDYDGASWTLWAKYTYAFIEKAATEAGLCCARMDWPSPDLQQWIVFFLPENEDAVRRMDSTELNSQLRQQLGFCRERLLQLERHPYVRLGLALNRAFKWLGFVRGRFSRTFGARNRKAR